MKKQYWITLGVAAGMIIGRILAPYINSFIGNQVKKASSNIVTENHINTFINDSVEITLTFASYSFREVRFSHFLTDDIASHNYIFYDPEDKKYMSIQMTTIFGPLRSTLDIAKNALIQCTVNKKQLSDPYYGTKENPVLVFKCIIPPNSKWDQYDKRDAERVIQYNDDYKKSIFNYLTYFTPKEEFQKMFPDQK
ncbi:hypothetical protein [Mucilaginibacter jinjuensis]|uniref:DUF8188 domain-containing protein n=1 Tax=Mucilaginibacter jinjuensis TaxID=1176721 RepID=A0ABY7T9G4_9SPHI|nr:hypothetical protein [Mucilaginibacter jinjuensis]WCT13124.1 hypothetical protein PQO05_04145 [Mucilaginibacter jinjuensis]